ncbi:MAG: IPT/TIG domain-containing protein [Planctomycetes bacterium]|nr:IPT/TIG domain-containing protein [Planctomycetota bacterium]
MRRSAGLLPCLLAAGLSLALASCGAGIFGGIAASNRNRSGSTPPPAQPPELSLPEPTAPLVPAVAFFGRAVLSNFQVAASSSLRVEIRALDAVSVQKSPVLLSVQGNSSVIGFVYENAEIRARVQDPTAADVDALLAVLVNGSEVAKPAALKLLRQPRAVLVPPSPGAAVAFLAMRGGTRVGFQVSGLTTERAEDLRVQFGVPDPDGGAAARVQEGTAITLASAGGSTVVSVAAPGNTFATRAFATVIDPRAGLSTAVSDLYYQPEIDVVSPRLGVSDGGTQLTLSGQGLVPFEFPPGGGRPSLDFSKVALSFRKGGRQTPVPAAAIRTDLSTSNRIVFTSPASPDGRAGPAEIVLRVGLGTVQAEARATGLFGYGYQGVTLGPRGTLLPEPAIGFTLLPVLDPLGINVDAVQLSEVGGFARLTLLGNRGNGLFERLGGSLVAGTVSDPGQRGPVDLARGDFDGDDRDDLVVANFGFLGSAGHGITLNQAAPLAPLRFMGGLVRDSDGARRARAADLDRNGLADVLILRGAGGVGLESSVFLADPPVAGAPRFRSGAPIPGANGAFDAFDVGDLDGDGLLDVVYAAGGIAPRLVTAFGRGDGTFAAGQDLGLVVPGHAPVATSSVVGVHLAGPSAPRSVTVVLSGTPASTTSPPCVAVLRPGTQARTLEQPVAGDVVLFPSVDQAFATSVAGDLDGDGTVELVVAAGGLAPRIPLRLFRWSAGTFVEVVDGADLGVEALRDVQRLAIGVVAREDTGRVERTMRGLFVQHRYLVDGLEENRISTLVAGIDARLAAPDAGVQLPQAVRGLVAGDFRGRALSGGSGSAADLYALTDQGLQPLANDGIGGLKPGSLLPATDVVGSSLAALRLRGASAESLVFLEASTGRLAILVAGESLPRVLDVDLRRVLPLEVRNRALGPDSRVRVADVDGDENLDVIVLLVPDLGVDRREGQAALYLLRGKAAFAPAEFPFHAPDAQLGIPLVHGNSSDVVLGDFAVQTGGARLLEAAVAVPEGSLLAPEEGNHLRFFRYDPGLANDPGDDRFVRSHAEETLKVLLAGDGPTCLAAADFDGNQTVDLVVASSRDARIRILLNQGLVVPGRETEVNLAAFVEGAASRRILPSGRCRELFLGDLDGDQIPDLLAVVKRETVVQEFLAALFLSDGNGGLEDGGTLPPVRTGNLVLQSGALVPRDATAWSVFADLNHDAFPDLAMGWGTAGTGDRNLRLLFCGVR